MLLLSLGVILFLSALDDSVAIKAILIDFGLGSIQSVMWVMFFLGVGELLHRFLQMQKVQEGFSKNYLPEDNTTVLELNHMPKLFIKVKEDAMLEGSLAGMIKTLVSQFQTSGSVEQTHQMLNSQVEMGSATSDLHYNMVRYIAWLIPTLGFIGTVIGIMLGLEYAATHNPESTTFLGEVIAKLAVAFYTTLVALIMSTVLVFFTHIVQGKEDSLNVRIAQYCLDHFINRLYETK
jgi:biopolymer transport protein ExbB/TolQ